MTFEKKKKLCRIFKHFFLEYISFCYFCKWCVIYRRFGTWPVAMLAQSKNKATLEGPVCNGSQVIGWHTNEKSKKLRRFHVDMSGFAFNSSILWDPKRWGRPTSDPIRQLDTVREGFQVCFVFFQTYINVHKHCWQLISDNLQCHRRKSKIMHGRVTRKHYHSIPTAQMNATSLGTSTSLFSFMSLIWKHCLLWAYLKRL